MLGIVALTIFALLRRFRPAQEAVGLPEQQQIQDALDDEHDDRSLGDTLRDYMAVPSVIMRWMFPAIIMLSAYLFLRGHDLPGGGFAAGIALAIAFLLQYLGSNVRDVEDRLRILPVRWMGLGLLVAAGTGMGAWLFGFPFLTSHARYLELPLVGRVPFATALLFDLGVYLLVVGATVLILVAIAHQSLRSSRAADEDPAGNAAAAGRTADGGGARARDRRARRLGRLAAAAAAHLPGDHRAGAALLRGQPLHLRDGPAPRRRRADPRASPASSTPPPMPTRCRRRWC